ncbi:hypothetical protein K469DRAFT_771505 [Zopfia rhizophila CBS 207.26]|uniref:Uncharacterized protein n=1 Tax=Zopfia rhizophila CBS 207.26 TaxID=1314779 RepID=A0A6A6D927_9PEZI|nr:hypothetical protein K469DRAFT_771505 [Zopfia rhizophila CBS 207.26]
MVQGGFVKYWLGAETGSACTNNSAEGAQPRGGDILVKAAVLVFGSDTVRSGIVVEECIVQHASGTDGSALKVKNDELRLSFQHQFGSLVLAIGWTAWCSSALRNEETKGLMPHPPSKIGPIADWLLDLPRHYITPHRLNDGYLQNLLLSVAIF